MTKKKIIRATTVPLSLNIFCRDILKELNQEYDVIGVTSDGPEFDEIVQREGVRVVKLEMERRISLTKDIKSLWSLCRLFSKEKPDMVHSMTPKAGLLCMIAAWVTHVPVRVHTFTGLVWPTATGMSRQILMLTDKITCACATHIIPEGEGVKSDLLSGGITQKPMKVLGYGNVKGIDLGYWTKENTIGVEKNPEVFTFLFVGRIVGDKGINELVQAFVRLKDAKPCRLLLVGWDEKQQDPIREDTRRLIESTKEIEMPGPKAGQALLDSYAMSNCFVFPSYREGFPNTVIEAGAMGLPCIVTDINGAREIISRDGNNRLNAGERMSIRPNGVVIPSKDEEAIYDAMLWMLTHREEQMLMAEKARKIVAERYDQRFVRQQLYDFYHEIL